MRVEVVTPERLVWSGPAEMVIARGVDGELGILPHHMPLITALLDSPLEIRLPGGGRTIIATRGGFLEVKPDRVTVLADEADLPEEQHDVAGAQAGETDADG